MEKVFDRNSVHLLTFYDVQNGQRKSGKCCLVCSVGLSIAI